MKTNQTQITDRAKSSVALKILARSLAFIAITSVAVAQPRYAVIDLGVLPGTASSAAGSLNDRGDVVGSCSSGSFSAVGFVWHNGVMTSTGRLPKGNYSGATAINLSGVVVGDGDIGNFRPQAWVATGSGLMELAPNSGNSHAIAINNNGTIGGYYAKGLDGFVSSWKGVIWTPDPKDPRKYRATDLPIIVGPDPTFKGTAAIPMAFNQSGQAAGYADNEVIGQHACFWNNDAVHSIVDLGPFPGDWSSIGWGMNDVGQVVGESHPPFGSRPVVWDNDAAHTAIELPLLPGDNYGMASRINNLGQILGSSATSEPGTWNIGPARLVLWRDGGVFELQTLLDPATGAGWTITSFSAINNLGQIAGVGARNGTTHAILLTPIAQ